MINWGIIGLGNMANKFAQAIREVNNAKLVSIASKSISKLNQFGDTFKIDLANRHNNYNTLINSKKIDAIYISTLNNTHSELILSCAENKKKILCEKPMAINYFESNKIYEYSKKVEIQFNEAIAYRSHPQTYQIMKLVNEGEIGNISLIESSFGFKIKNIKTDSRLFNKKLGGGAILDLGCYPISFFNLFCNNNEIKFIDSKGSFAKTGVDDHAEINLLIGENIKANGKVSLKENYNNSCIIHGDNGRIIIPSPWLPEKKSYIEIFKKNTTYKKFTNTNKSIYAHQIENISSEFKNIDNENNKFLVNISESNKIMKIISNWSNSLAT